MDIQDKNMTALYFDGGSRGNPGPGGCGVSIQSKDSELFSYNKYIGHCTNNFAEYKALEFGLQLAIDNDITELTVYGDSLLVINQVNGLWRCKNLNLKTVLDNIKLLKLKFKTITFKHIKREKNKRADELANIAMDNN